MHALTREPSAKQTAECEARVLESIFLETTSRKGQQEHYGSNNRRITSDDLTENDLLPPPVKKKYSKEHVLLLIFIYYYKGIIPMNEIQTLLKPLTDRYFQNGQVFDLESVYKEVVVLEKEQLEDLKKDVVEKFRRAEDSFTEVTGEEQEFLQKFALICLLSFDVYMKKMIVEQLVADLADTMKAQEPEKEAHKKKN